MYVTKEQPFAEPSRIISLVPSITELLIYLGLTDRVIGITKFCVHPPGLRLLKTIIGGTKSIRIDNVRDLKPDLIIANKEENVKEQVDELAGDYPVLLTDISSMEDACQMIIAVGILCNCQPASTQLVEDIQCEFKKLEDRPITNILAAYLIWRDPYMAAGGDTFISNLMQMAGYLNVFADRQRYPIINIQDILQAGCKCLLLSSEPFPFKSSHADELRDLLPGIEIILVDGEMFSWYGSRLLHFVSYVSSMEN